MEPIRSDIQSGYDKVASAYAQAFIDEQAKKPMDHEMLQRFADETHGKGIVCDMGCGPGQVGAWLNEHCGVKGVIGIDLSPRFIEEAHKLHPQIGFVQGDMLDLEQPDNSWAGVVAFYSLIHIPHDQIVDALKEIKRVLKPGGLLLLTFHIGSDIVHVDKFFEQDVSMDFVMFQPDEMEGYLRLAGYDSLETTVRGPYAPEVEHQSHRAYIFARKPGN
ncbi:MAG: class I SAM-dependent methyltransferase [Anaerolineaceae bacterium]